MITLSKGFKLPETGDFGDVWFPALEDNITQLNSHKHDGVDSEKLSGSDLEISTVTALVGSFTDQGNGYYRALVLCPGGLAVSSFRVSMRDPTSFEPIFGKIELASTAAVYVYLNSPQTVEVIFGV